MPPSLPPSLSLFLRARVAHTHLMWSYVWQSSRRRRRRGDQRVVDAVVLFAVNTGRLEEGLLDQVERALEVGQQRCLSCCYASASQDAFGRLPGDPF